MLYFSESHLLLCVHLILAGSSTEKTLKWCDRLQVLIAIAKAVHFLHTGIIPGSLYNRLKPCSILIDEHLTAKLSDYGFSILTEVIYKQEVVSSFPMNDFPLFSTNLLYFNRSTSRVEILVLTCLSMRCLQVIGESKRYIQSHAAET